jgi:hypothetical protein
VATVIVRPATDAEIGLAYRSDAEHVVAVVDGQVVAYISFRTVDGRRWGGYIVLSDADPSVWNAIFYAFRRALRRQTEVVYVRAQDDGAPRLLRLLGLTPANETFAGKDLWVWKPGRDA